MMNRLKTSNFNIHHLNNNVKPSTVRSESYSGYYFQAVTNSQNMVIRGTLYQTTTDQVSITDNF